MRTGTTLRVIALALVVGVGLGGCKKEEEKPQRRGASKAAQARIRPGQPSTEAMDKSQKLQRDQFHATQTGSGDVPTTELIPHKVTEESFIEAPTRRDPFRSFIVPLTQKSSSSSQPQVDAILTEYQLDELTLIAIISGAGTASGAPMAMVVDPTGLGHIIRRGNYVGRGESVRMLHSNEELIIYWKVARIREDAVVFERDDPLSPTEATVTKILSLESGS